MTILDLPSGWGTRRLDDLLLFSDSGTWGDPGTPKIGLPVLRSTNIRAWKLDTVADLAFRSVPERDRQRKRLRFGDIIVTKSSGSPHLIGEAALFDVQNEDVVFLFSNFIQRLRPDPRMVSPRYLHYYLQSPAARNVINEMQRTTSGLRNLKLQEYDSQDVPIPYPDDPARSLAEQRRIVARLEALLGEVRELRQLQAEIEADVGRLMEAVLAEVFGVLNVPTKPLESVATEIYRYPTFYGLNQVTSGVPVVRGEHIKYDGRLITDWQEYWYISQDTSNQFPRTVLTPGDLVCTVRGTIGKIGLIEESHRNANLSPNLIRISPDRTQIAPRYLWWYLRSPFGQADIKGRSDAAVISTIKASTLKQAPIPTPNELFVQTQIAEHLDRVFQEINEMGVICRDDKLSLDSFEQSILDQAFRGEL